jgi:hypothetical protein
VRIYGRGTSDVSAWITGAFIKDDDPPPTVSEAPCYRGNRRFHVGRCLTLEIQLGGRRRHAVQHIVRRGQHVATGGFIML